MKFRISEIIFGSLLTIAVFSAGIIFSWPPDKSSADHEEKADDKVARYTLYLAVLTGGLVIVSGWQGYFLLRAERTSQSLAKLAREEFVATHRPRVIVRFLQGPFHDDNAREFCWVTLANVGETTAAILAFGGDLTRRNRANGEWRIPGLDASPKPVDQVSLESGQRHTVKIVSKSPVSESELFGDATGTYELCAVGCVRYEDGNGLTRKTSFFRTHRDGEQGFSPSANTENEYED